MHFTVQGLLYLSLNWSHSEREKSRNANLIVQMESNTTILVDPNHPKAEPRKFTFDHSYWSHDGYSMREKDGYLEPASPKYTDQVRDILWIICAFPFAFVLS